MYRNTCLQLAAGYKVCRHCHRQKPLSDFEQVTAAGARRGVCNDCKYLLYTVPARLRRQLRESEEERFFRGR